MGTCNGGFFSRTGNDKLIYQIADHLGSIRVIKDGEGTVLQRFDYYPSGSESRVWTAGTSTPQSALRYRFGGKEIAGQKAGASALTGTPAAAAGSPYLDFGARLYDPRTAAWLSQDPMAEKYYPISPYVYCAGNPVNLVDPEGTDWYIISQSGEFRIIENRPTEDFDRLFADFFMGPPDMTTSIVVRDKTILSSLSELKRSPYSVSHNDIENVFYFAADVFIGQEWGLYSDGKQYAIVTSGSKEAVESPLENTIWKIHSHSDTPPNDKEEIQSMGYWFYYENQAFGADGKLKDKNSPWFVASKRPNDLSNLRESGISSYVYFPLSGHTYKMNKNTLPSLVNIRHKK